MDLILEPTSLNLTTQLIQRTGAGEFADEEVLESEVLWSYEIPSINRNEFYYQGTYTDETPPTFIPLSYSNGSNCYIRQLTGREYINPGFEIEFTIEEQESLTDLFYRIGTFDNGNDVISITEINGQRLVMPHLLLSTNQMTATITATNQNGQESVAMCRLQNYDLSPPQARVIPISDITSHPNQFEVLLVLFDEYGLTDNMEVAVGTIPGDEGNDLLDWITLTTSMIDEIPDETGLGLYSFGRVCTCTCKCLCLSVLKYIYMYQASISVFLAYV